MGECESNWTGSRYVFPHVVRINWSPLYVFPYVVRIHSGEINLILLSKERASGKRLWPSGAVWATMIITVLIMIQMRRDKQWRVNKWADYMASNNYFISPARCSTKIGVVFAHLPSWTQWASFVIRYVINPPRWNQQYGILFWCLGCGPSWTLGRESIIHPVPLNGGLNSNKDEWNSFLMLSSKWHFTLSGSWQGSQMGCVSARLVHPTI